MCKTRFVIGDQFEQTCEGLDGFLPPAQSFQGQTAVEQGAGPVGVTSQQVVVGSQGAGFVAGSLQAQSVFEPGRKVVRIEGQDLGPGRGGSGVSSVPRQQIRQTLADFNLFRGQIAGFEQFGFRLARAAESQKSLGQGKPSQNIRRILLENIPQDFHRLGVFLLLERQPAGQAPRRGIVFEGFRERGEQPFGLPGIPQAAINLGDLENQDGVVVIPASIADAVVTEAEVQAATEDKIRAAILGGISPKDASLEHGKF